MASKYRRVKWEREDAITVNGRPVKETKVTEGWMHHAVGLGHKALVETDDGKMEDRYFRDLTFITPPNADMENVCESCGRVLAPIPESHLPVIDYWEYECANPDCPGKEARDANG